MIMEDVSSKTNNTASVISHLGRSSNSSDASLAGIEHSFDNVLDAGKDTLFSASRIDNMPAAEPDINSLMAVLSQLALAPVTQSTTPINDCGFNASDGIFGSGVCSGFQPDLCGNLHADSVIFRNFAQQSSWCQRDESQFRGLPPIGLPVMTFDKNQVNNAWDGIKLPSAYNWQLGKLGPRGLGVNNHNRSMSAQNLNASSNGQCLPKSSEFGPGINQGGNQNHAKQLSDHVQRYGSSFSSLLENNLENEQSLLSNQNVLLDLLRNASGSSNGGSVGMTSAMPDIRHLLRDHSFNYVDPSYSALSLVKPASQLASIDSGEVYSRKVFVGGLPPDIDEEEILSSFHRFGSVLVDWPHKAESKSYFPPKGYCFLLFEDEKSVQALVRVCLVENSKLYWHVSSPTMKDKAVQIRPWKLSDCDFVTDSGQPLDPRKTVFVGGVPRPMRAVELAMVMSRMYGPVCYTGIDTDPDLKYPKGAGRVTFSTQQSFLAAINSRFVQLQHGDIDKRVEVKPYVLEDQICDECQGLRSGGKHAPFFCANVVCLQYYCDQCWAIVHSSPGREFHKPLVKDGADRPRTMPFRMC